MESEEIDLISAHRWHTCRSGIGTTLRLVEVLEELVVEVLSLSARLPMELGVETVIDDPLVEGDRGIRSLASGGLFGGRDGVRGRVETEVGGVGGLARDRCRVLSGEAARIHARVSEGGEGCGETRVLRHLSVEVRERGCGGPDHPGWDRGRTEV